jgi:hypothetical protein
MCQRERNKHWEVKCKLSSFSVKPLGRAGNFTAAVSESQSTPRVLLDIPALYRDGKGWQSSRSVDGKCRFQVENAKLRPNPLV